MDLPDKPAGAKYFILLRTPDHSHLKTAVAGGLGLGGKLPPLSFQRAGCICCNQDAQGRSQKVPLFSTHFKAEPLLAPVCELCAKHAIGGPGGPLFGIGLGIAGVAFALYFATISLIALGIGVALALLGAFVAWIGYKQQADRAGVGHAPGLQVLMSAGQLAVHTGNRELAAEIVAHHGAFVARVR